MVRTHNGLEGRRVRSMRVGQTRGRMVRWCPIDKRSEYTETCTTLENNIIQQVGFGMTTSTTPMRNEPTVAAHQQQAAHGLAIVRLTIGAMFVSVFFENLGKGLYRPA